MLAACEYHHPGFTFWFPTESGSGQMHIIHVHLCSAQCIRNDAHTLSDTHTHTHLVTAVSELQPLLRCPDANLNIFRHGNLLKDRNLFLTGLFLGVMRNSCVGWHPSLLNLFLLFASFFFCPWKGGVEQCYQRVRTDGHHSSPSPLTHDLTAGLKAVTCVHEEGWAREKQREAKQIISSSQIPKKLDELSNKPFEKDSLCEYTTHLCNISSSILVKYAKTASIYGYFFSLTAV